MVADGNKPKRLLSVNYTTKKKKIHKVISKVSERLKFLHRKKKYLTSNLLRLLCNALIQPHFECTFSAWYPNLSKKLKNKFQTSPNKWICFCQQLHKIAHISKKIETINRFPVKERFNLCINSIVFKYFDKQRRHYLN